jgi:hypothetical protein
MNHLQNLPKATSGNHRVPPPPPVEGGGRARTVLAGKGSLRRAVARPWLLRAVPAGLRTATGGSGGNTRTFSS